jgi:hypothetical protein
MEKDASYSTSADIIATADLPFELPSLTPVADVAIDSSSTRTFGTEHIEYRPLDPVYAQHDIV